MNRVQELLSSYPKHYATVPTSKDFVDGRRGFYAASQFTRNVIFNEPYTFNTVIITGTNGKGSTGSILSHMCHQSGLKVGTISSPAMREDCTDMIKINGIPILPDDLLTNLHDAVTKLEPIAHNQKLTHYMPICVAAYNYFKEEGVNIVIAETAIGGLHDPTVPFKPDICLFTNITSDHEDVLGGTFNQVARHKSRIIGMNSTVILSEQITDEIAGVISGYAKRKNADIIRVDGGETQPSGIVYEKQGIKIIGGSVHCPKYQYPNLRLAAEAFANIQGRQKNDISIDLNGPPVDGLFPENRYEFRVRNGVRYLFDSAHNTDSYKKLAASLAEHFDLDDLYFFKGASDQHSLDEFRNILRPQHVMYVSGYHERVIRQNNFVNLSDINFDEVENKIGADKIIVICGIFLAPKVKELLFSEPLPKVATDYTHRLNP